MAATAGARSSEPQLVRMRPGHAGRARLTVPADVPPGRQTGTGGQGQGGQDGLTEHRSHLAELGEPARSLAGICGQGTGSQRPTQTRKDREQGSTACRHQSTEPASKHRINISTMRTNRKGTPGGSIPFEPQRHVWGINPLRSFRR